MTEKYTAKKKLYSIGEVSAFMSVNVHTIRYWEREFKGYLVPPRTEGGQRRYSTKDIDRLWRIKYLLKEQGYSIAGAMKRIAEEIKK